MKNISRNSIQKKLGTFRSVSQLANNQYVIEFDNGTAFQSYSSLIGIRLGSSLYLTSDHDYSVTTNKYCKAWCGLSAEERRKMLEDGTATKIAA